MRVVAISLLTRSTKLGAVVSTRPHCAERLRSPILPCGRAVLDRSGVAALLRTEILRWSAALLGITIADVNLAARPPSPSLPAPFLRFPISSAPESLSSSFRFGCPWVPCSSVSRRARLPSTFRTSHARPSRTSGKWGLCPVDNEDIVDYCAAEPIPARNCALGPCPQSIESFGSL